MKQRPVTVERDSIGTYVRVPVGKLPTEHYATIDLTDWETLLGKGYTGNLGGVVSQRHGKIYVIASNSHTPGGYVLVARVLLGAEKGMRIRYVDGNPLNLRRSNLNIEHSQRK